MPTVVFVAVDHTWSLYQFSTPVDSGCGMFVFSALKHKNSFVPVLLHVRVVEAATQAALQHACECLHGYITITTIVVVLHPSS